MWPCKFLERLLQLNLKLLNRKVIFLASVICVDATQSNYFQLLSSYTKKKCEINYNLFEEKARIFNVVCIVILLCSNTFSLKIKIVI